MSNAPVHPVAITSTVKIHTYSTELWLPASREKVFSFFADARNLAVITPPWLRFEILTPGELTTRAGLLIDYRLRWHGLPLHWQTEITVWEPHVRFVDVQRRGPYRQWEHTHTFAEADCGTWCRDEVRYAVVGGAWIDRAFVRRDIERIFAFRAEAMRNLYPAGG